MAINISQNFFGEVLQLKNRMLKSEVLSSIPRSAYFASVEHPEAYFERLYFLQKRFLSLLQGSEFQRGLAQTDIALAELYLFEKDVQSLQTTLNELLASITSEAIALERIILMFRKGFLASINVEPSQLVSKLMVDDWPVELAAEKLNSLLPIYENAGCAPEDLSAIVSAIDTFEVLYCHKQKPEIPLPEGLIYL